MSREIEVKVTEYGDLSSLAVEYPDYNSLGQPLLSLLKTSTKSLTSEAYKYSGSINYNDRIKKLSDLTGRGVIVTLNKDLIAYGILVNETMDKG